MEMALDVCICSWIVFTFLMAVAFTVFALVKIDSLNKWSGCRTETCVVVMYRVRNMSAAVTYAFTLVVFFCTCKSSFWTSLFKSKTGYIFIRLYQFCLLSFFPTLPRRQTFRCVLLPFFSSSFFWLTSLSGFLKTIKEQISKILRLKNPS